MPGRAPDDDMKLACVVEMTLAVTNFLRKRPSLSSRCVRSFSKPLQGDRVPPSNALNLLVS